MRFLGVGIHGKGPVQCFEYLKWKRESEMMKLLQQEWQRLDPETTTTWSKRDKTRASLLSCTGTKVLLLSIPAMDDLPAHMLPVLRSEAPQESLWVELDAAHLDFLVQAVQ